MTHKHRSTLLPFLSLLYCFLPSGFLCEQICDIMSQSIEKTTEKPESPAAGQDDSLKRRAPEEEDAASSPAEKRAKTEAPLDLAVTLGYKDGDRVEVEWEIENDNGETTVHWWGATLLSHDGRTEDSVAIRQLKYDPHQKFESSVEDVIFLGSNLLVSPDSQNQLTFRREGEEEVQWYNEGDLNESLNNILMTAMSKNSEAWKTLSPARQAMIAEKIASKKEKLIEALRGHNGVITSETIQDVIAKAFA